ncbi:hypothetical protein tloyanaT_07800 [Thalassotalea loyana]|uniref:ZP domain-containing protein n=1 Tax=Thalassotalea loyana TaxID=280483 RepID=A0ABQ6H8U9_9GAMM|nr:hypothetical protein [Thalassotalea loyana]GLX84528.1 hypothetical protein tloyanaT_07800 [Thalassotalea loyana]
MDTVLELPEFDTGLYDGCHFLHSGVNAELNIRINEVGTRVFTFEKVRSYKFTALPNCTAQMISAYFKIVDCGSTKSLGEFKASNSFDNRMDSSLKHYMIFLDETGCYEVYAENVT